MPGKRKESEQDAGIGTGFPNLASGIGTRIKTAASKVGTRASAAKAAGVSDDMLYRYIREQSPPSFSAMSGLAAAAGVRLEWIATGEGRPEARSAESESQGELDLDLLEHVAHTTFEELDDRGLTLDPANKARLVRVLYRHFVSRKEQVDHETVSNIIDLAAFR